jgi:hypothetical protein
MLKALIQQIKIKYNFNKQYCIYRHTVDTEHKAGHRVRLLITLVHNAYEM